MRAGFCILLLTVAGLATEAAADARPYGDTLAFSATRNGQAIGRHALTFTRDGERLVVDTSIDLAVTLLGFTVYKYRHRNREVWLGTRWMSFDSTTDDNGKPYAVKAQVANDNVVVERELPRSGFFDHANDRGFHRAGPIRDRLTADVLPSTHWNIRQVTQARLLNTQTGAVDRSDVTTGQRETVATARGTVEATRYIYSGDVKFDQWFDARGRWVKMAFPAPDGSKIEYVLQD